MSCIDIGIDPGATGAIALLIDGNVSVFDMPTLFVRTGKTDKRRTDIPALLDLCRALQSVGAIQATVENVWGVRGQGAGQGAALGHQRGCIETALAATGISYNLVSAQRWKGDAGLMRRGEPVDKAKSVALAVHTWPDSAALFTPVRGKLTAKQCEGRAEAALIARHASLQCR